MFTIVSSSHLFGQEKSNVYVGEYLKTRFFYLHNFRINENLSQLGTNEISCFDLTESFGLKLRLENGFTANLDESNVTVKGITLPFLLASFSFFCITPGRTVAI